MVEFTGGNSKSINADEHIIFENNTDSDFSVSAAIVFRKSGLYDVSIVGRRTIISKVAERKKGEWNVTDAYPHNVYCSECHKRFAQTHWAVWEDGSLPRNFCPNCGADMRGEQDG